MKLALFKTLGSLKLKTLNYQLSLYYNIAIWKRVCSSFQKKKQTKKPRKKTEQL